MANERRPAQYQLIGLAVLAAVVWVMSLAAAAELGAPLPAAKGNQFAIAALPDPQAYTQSYDITKGNEKWGGKGYQYKDRLDQQVRWIVENRTIYNIRFAVSLGDSVQHFGYDEAKAADASTFDGKVKGEWLNAERSYNLFHPDGDPTKAAFVPYAIACGNHDYHLGNQSDLDSREYERLFGPGRWRGADGAIRTAFRDWYRGDDRGHEHKADGQSAATGVGRNSWQVFSGGGRTFLHLTLECAATEQAIAWAKSVLKENPDKPTILTTHTFISGAGKLITVEKMGRHVTRGKNPTNGSQAIWDKLIKDHDQIFMVLCGHSYSQEHVVLKNAAGHDVHVLEACYHLNYDGGRIRVGEKPAGGWAYKGESDDLDRNGCGWLRLILFDPDRGRVLVRTYSPVLGLWATNRAPGDRSRPDGENGVWWTRTFPVGKDVEEEFGLDFQQRLGPAAGAKPASAPEKAD